MENEVMDMMDVDDVVENGECTALVDGGSEENKSNTVLVVGGAMIVGGLLTKFVVTPAVNKVKTVWKNHKAKKAAKAQAETKTDETEVDVKFEEVKVESEQ